MLISGFELIDVASRQGMASLLAMNRFDAVVHLAAQAGVRYSLTNPHAYVDANLVGFINVLEGARNHAVKHLCICVFQLRAWGEYQVAVLGAR